MADPVATEYPVASTSTAGSVTTPSTSTATPAQGVAPEPPRTGRACLSCRKLKTRCDGADDPPCKRCTAAGTDCVFVESKRGKRPARKPDLTLADKLKSVESSLAMVLESIHAGGQPDHRVIESLQQSLSEGLKAPDRVLLEDPKDDRKREVFKVKERSRSGSGGEDGEEGDGGRAVYSAAAVTVDDSHDSPLPTSPRRAKRPRTSFSSVGPSAGLESLASPSFIPSHPTALTSMHHHSSAAPTSLSMLADASLAAEIGGRAQITGLTPTFNLSSVTAALALRERYAGPPEPGGRTPALLSKGIISAETAVQLFRDFFDFAYIHLPLIDPEYNTALSVCSRSPFLFTVICAVASRFTADIDVHLKCYDEAHACFVECVSGSERNIEAVQACMILTVWTSAPRGAENRQKRASLYFCNAVRMGLELGLFRPAPFADAHLSKPGVAQLANPWMSLPEDLSEEEQREALGRERTWLMAFVIDRNMSAVMGRPYQIQEANPLLIPLHPLSLPFDLGVVAHQELQVIIGQVMDTFKTRIYGLSSASDDMPSPTLMKLFNSRMDDWRQRWCPVPGEPIANNLLFYFFSSKLFLNTFPLQSMLRAGPSAVEDPECVSVTISSAKSILDLAHKYAELGVLQHCPDFNFLVLLYAAVFLFKVKSSNTRFAQLLEASELTNLTLQSIDDCQRAICSPKHAAANCSVMLRALLASWKAMSAESASSSGAALDPALECDGQSAPPPAEASAAPDTTFASYLAAGLSGTLAGAPSSPAPYAYLSSPFHGSGAATPLNSAGAEPLDNFLSDTNFFNSVLVSQGAEGFFSWDLGWEAATSIDQNFADGSSMF